MKFYHASYNAWTPKKEYRLQTQRHGVFKGTVAYDDKIEVDMLSLTIRLRMGVAQLHPGDQYVRKVGREIAIDRMREYQGNIIMLKSQAFEGTTVCADFAGVMFTFHGPDPEHLHITHVSLKSW